MNTQLSESSNHMSKELFDLADQQAGYFTVMQAHKLGYSYDYYIASDCNQASNPPILLTL